MLQLNIPETVLQNESTSCIISTENELVKVDSFISNDAFMNKLPLQSMEGSIFPVVLHSSISGIAFSNSILMSNELTENKLIPRNESYVYRRFVRPYGEKPNLLRLFYRPKTRNCIKKNYGYKMVSHYQMNEELFKKKQRLNHHYIVNPEKTDSYSSTLIKGKALEPFEKMAYSLTQYL